MRYAVLAVVSNCCPPLKGRFLTRYSPVRHCPRLPLTEVSFHRFSFDLHVLSTPPAFVLSQDQTLNKMVSKRASARPNHFIEANLSFKLNVSLHRVIDLTPMRNFIIVRILSDAELWCFSFVTLFNLQGTRPARLSGGTFDILADSFRFVKHFFQLFSKFFSTLIRIDVPCQTA